MGSEKEQTENELRKAVPWPAVLLRQEHNPQNRWKKVRKNRSYLGKQTRPLIPETDSPFQIRVPICL